MRARAGGMVVEDRCFPQVPRIELAVGTAPELERQRGEGVGLAHRIEAENIRLILSRWRG